MLKKQKKKKFIKICLASEKVFRWVFKNSGEEEDIPDRRLENIFDEKEENK